MSKEILRKKLIDLRKNYFAGQKISFPKFEKILNKFYLRKKIFIGGYFPINSEIGCLEVLEELEKNKFKISLPVVKKNNSMDFYDWSFQEPLKINKLGIPEPDSKKKVYPDVLIIPLVGFDKNKFRLGYGGGYYDRYINSISKIKKIFKIGFAFSFQEILKLPVDKYDQKLDAILTDKKIII